MGKPYINNAVIGNGSMLGCITETGELIRLYWPEIDYPQHLEKMLTGFFDANVPNSTLWFSEGDHEVKQRYLEDTNILETKAFFLKLPLEVTQTDFCLSDQDVLVRHYELRNTGNEAFHAGMGIASHVISSHDDMGNTLFDFRHDALIHYRHDGCWAICSSLMTKQFQIGNNPFRALWEGRLNNGPDYIGMSPDGALLWDLGVLQPGNSRSITLYLCFARDLAGVKALIGRVKMSSYSALVRSVQQYWYDFLNGCSPVKSGNEIADRLYKRSLLLFRLMSDANTGGLLASPEIDEGFTQCGRYAYCWCRDGAFITRALDEAGLVKDSAKFFDWASRVQDTEGFWHQRYHMNGSLAPSWGIQIDETGSMLFGMLCHFYTTKDLFFLEKMWPSIVKAAAFLESFIDEETGLPRPTFDIWEERMGEHTYSTAAVIAGLNSAAEMGRQLNVPDETTQRWERTARNMKKAMEQELIDHENRIFLRSIRTKLNPWGKEPGDETVWIRVNPKGFSREVTLKDSRMDISLLGPVIPFKVFAHDDPIVRKTAAQIEQILTCIDTGGIYRYDEDNYAGGNPWIIATLWMALYFIETGELEKAASCVKWCIGSCNHLELLPEQVSRQDGKPCWVVPLTWSHAMYVLALRGLLKNGGSLMQV